MKESATGLQTKTDGGLHPSLRRGSDATLAGKRNLISSVFIAMLIGLAYQEMLAPVRDSVRASGLTAGTLFLAFTFFFTSMRFFIGNQLHLLSDSVLCLRGDMWLFDFLVITLQTVLLCFLGGVSSVEVNRIAHIGFFGLLIALYALDVGWVVCQGLLGLCVPAWKRAFVPWAWAILNAGLLGAITLIRCFCPDAYSSMSLGLLFGVSLIAFVIDMVLIDHYDVV